MKATTQIRKAIEERLKVKEEDCTIIYQAKYWGATSSTTFYVAIVEINAQAEFYAIKVWNNGASKFNLIKENTTLHEAFLKIMQLD